MYKMQSNIFQDINKMDAEEYKRYHESFMENNRGSTILHTFFSIFFTVLCSIFCSVKTDTRADFRSFFFEYGIIVLPLVLGHTVLAEHTHFLNVFMIIFIIYKIYSIDITLLSVSSSFKLKNRFPTEKTLSVTIMRALTYLITVFCILAVDFQDFPRYLAKTEKYGYSLMDTGVGLFVLMSGLVHKNVNKNNYVEVIKGNIKFITILFLLGYARYVSLKQLDYQEHVTEYGVHWNFFYTLALCKFLSSVILFFSNRPWIFSTIILMFHESLLYIWLEEWVFSNVPRTSLITANREGISSCLGYVSLYLFAVHFKKELNDQTKYRYEIFFKLLSSSLVLWIMSYIVNCYRPTSRTLVNAGYCLYLEGILVTVMSILYFFEVVFQNKNQNIYFIVPAIFLVINENGLVYFLVANVSTGIINMTWRTLSLSTSVVLVIVNSYMVATLILTAFLSQIGMKL